MTLSSSSSLTCRFLISSMIFLVHIRGAHGGREHRLDDLGQPRRPGSASGVRSKRAMRPIMSVGRAQRLDLVIGIARRRSRRTARVTGRVIRSIVVRKQASAEPAVDQHHVRMHEIRPVPDRQRIARPFAEVRRPLPDGPSARSGRHRREADAASADRRIGCSNQLASSPSPGRIAFHREHRLARLRRPARSTRRSRIPG